MSAAAMVRGRVGADSERAAGRPQWVYDPWLVGASALLLVIGVVMVYSASIAHAERVMGNGTYYLVRHVAHLVLGLALLYVTLRIPVRVWERLGPWLLLAGLLMLALVLVPGIGGQVNGSSRWIRLGFMNVQPSELMKLFMVIYVAGYLVRKQDALSNFTQGIVIMSLVVAVVGVLLLREPDLGSLVVIGFTVFTMLFLGGVRFWHFASVAAIGLGGMVLLTVIAPYRLGRVTSFLDPWADPFGSGFQLTQALIAFGRGEWFGAGLGASIQKLHYLPAAHTDFVFAVLGEELGLFGVLTVMGLSAIVLFRAFAVARAAADAGSLYGTRLAQGIGLLLGMQAIINMGVTMGALPTKGLTLPFVSYGGSSMIMCCVALGLLLRIGRESGARRWERETDRCTF